MLFEKFTSMIFVNRIFNLVNLYFFFISINASIPGVKEIAIQYCNDYGNVVIDSIVKSPKGQIYVFTDNVYMKIDAIAPNGVPVINYESPSMIKKFWGKMPNNIDTGFVFDNFLYFLKDGILWKHDPNITVGPRVNQINPENEFAFFNNRSDIYENILTVFKEPDPQNSYNDSKSTFIISYIASEADNQNIVINTFEGNTTKELSKQISIPLERVIIDLLYTESLVIDYWKTENDIVFKAIRFLDKMYLQLLYSQKDRSVIANKFSPNVRFRTIGYNQVWLGCPQPMCLDGTVDTIVKFEDKTELPFIVFRGRFYWNITTMRPPTTSNANLISEGWKGLPSYLDASYYDNDINELYFFKNEFLYSKRGEKWIPKPIKDVFAGIPTPIDAVFFIEKKERLFFFKDDKYYIFEVQSNQVITSGKISEFPGLPNYIDEAFIENDMIYIFKNWYYYKMDLKNFKEALLRASSLETREPEPVFKTWFHCPASIYDALTEYDTLDLYVRHFEPYTKPIAANNDSRIPDVKPVQILTTTTEVNVSETTEMTAITPNNSIQTDATQFTSVLTESEVTQISSSDIVDGGDGGEQSTDANDEEKSTNWIIYIILVIIIIGMIIITVIVFITNRKDNKSEKNVHKSKGNDPKNEPKINPSVIAKPKSPQNKDQKAAKVLSKGNATDFTISFEEPESDKSNIKIDFEEDSIEDTTPVPLKSVPTEQFLVTSNPHFGPDERPDESNLFSLNRQRQKSKSDNLRF